MSDFTKTTNFTAKDALTSGNPNKVVKGSQFDTEFDNLATSSATKSNKIISAVVDNVVTQSAAGDLVDAGYKFTELVGSVTSTTAELNILDGVTSTAAELNILDGVTATATELNTLDGISATLTPTELNYVEGVTSSIQTQLTAAMLKTENLSGLSDNLTARRNVGITTNPLWWDYLGSGDDGAVTHSANTNLTKGEYHYTNYTLEAGYTLSTTQSTESFLVIRCTGTATIKGTISLAGRGFTGGGGGASANGGVGTAGVMGAGGGSGSYDDGHIGGSGGASYYHNISVSGGGGSSSAINNGQAVSANSRMENSFKYLGDILLSGGAGGGGGCGNNGNAGAGGTGGGVIVIIADTIDNQSGATVTAAGGAGAYSANDGGGGGGGAGTVILIADSITNNGTVSVAGGAGGTSGVGRPVGGVGGAGYSASITRS